MFEARLAQGSVLKRILEAIKDLIDECNIICDDNGISIQAMDNSHVALVSLLLRSESFDPYRCDRSITLGVNLSVLAKVIKCAGNDDTVTLKAKETDLLTLVFENAKSAKISEYTIKLMDVDSDLLDIPDTVYDSTVHMQAVEFQRICRDLSQLSDSVTIDVAKAGVKFIAEGEMGNGNIVLRQDPTIDNEEEATFIDLQNPVKLAFALKYLASFTKTTSLSARVTLHMSSETPMMAEYKIDDVGYIHYYLAPKLDEDQ